MKKSFFSNFIFAFLINLACYAAAPAPEATRPELTQVNSAATTQPSDCPTVRIGAADLQQRSNQDVYTLYRLKMGDTKMLFVGVYDGHGDNAGVAQMLKNELHKEIFESFVTCHVDNKTYPSMSILIFEALEVLDKKSQENKHSGSTAVFGILDKSILCIANVGDSRAIIGNLDGSVAFETHDHKPNDPWECARIEAAGNFVYLDSIIFPGDKWVCFYKPDTQYPDINPEELNSLLITDSNWVMRETILSEIVNYKHKSNLYNDLSKYLDLSISSTSKCRITNLINIDPSEFEPLTKDDFSRRREIWRTGGGLGMSRSVGDYPKELGVVSKPDVYTIPLNNKEHHFAVFATDGLWDVLTNDDVAKTVSYNLRQGNDPSSIAQKLVNIAQCRGSDDDITVVIIVFDWPEAKEVAAQ